MPPNLPPQGIITCLFTDIEGSTHVSTRLRQEDYVRWVERHHERLRTLFAKHNGNEVDTQGDAFFATFQYSRDALACANAIQRSLRDEPISETDKDDATILHTIRVRIGIYRAKREVFLRGAANYIDSEINLASRIIKGGVGGQVLVSDLARQEAGSADDYQWETWKSRRLKDFDAPEDVHELLWDGTSRGEPGTRWMPDWYRGERNAYIPRVDKEKEILAHFATKPSNGNPVRLVTLKGFGGMGKTRLGLTCALQCVGMFNGEVYFVRLEDREKSPEAVAEAIGTALGLEGEARLPKNLIPILRDTKALLMLDNYESVHCSDVQKFLRDLLLQTSQLRLLVTGREKVNIGSGEQLVDIEGLTDAEAKQLFIARAQLVQPDWQPTTPQEEIAMSDILRLTERIPLALELVAAGMGDDAYGSVELVAKTLQDTPLPALPEGYISADPSERHESLTRCLDWSYNLLDVDTRNGFVRLGLFADTFTPATAQAATGVPDGNKLLTRLAQASLLKRVEPLTERRYTFLRPTHAYAETKLEAWPDANTLRRTYVAYYQNVARENGGWDSININDINKCRLLDIEWRNIVKAIYVAELLELWDVAQEFGGKLMNFFEVRGYWSEGIIVYLDLYDVARTQGMRKFESIALNNLGVFYDCQGRWDKALECYSQDVSICRELGDHKGEGETLGNIGAVLRKTGDWEAAIDCLKQSLTICREFKDRVGECGTLTNLGDVYADQEEWDEAISYYEQSLIISRHSGYDVLTAITLSNQGHAYRNQFLLNRALNCFRQSLAINQKLDNVVEVGRNLAGIALVLQAKYDIPGALENARQALLVLETTQDVQTTDWVRILIQKWEKFA